MEDMDHNTLTSTPCDSDLSATNASECSSDAPRLTYSEVRPRCNVNGERDNLYYKTYIGPELVSASIDGDDLTALIKELYGERCNWCETLYTFRSLHHSEYIGKLLRIEFRPRNPNVPEWTTIILDTLDTVINPPLFMPCPIV